MENLYGNLKLLLAGVGRTQQRNRLSLISPIPAKVAFIHRNYRMARVEFAHPNEAQIGEIRVPVGIAVCQFTQLR